MEYPDYKVVEISQVTDEELEKVINKWVAEGWLLDGIHFAMRESSRRPSMAFLVFTHSSETQKRDKAS